MATGNVLRFLLIVSLPAMQTQTSRWQEILNDPTLQDLPYKIETNELDQIVLSPHTRAHSRLQSKLCAQLEQRDEGVAFVELAIETKKGTKVPDVAWMRTERYESIPDDTEPTPIAPDLCVEIVSTSNTTAEITEKRSLYFEAGAREVWFFSTDGESQLFDADGPIETSSLFPEVPSRLQDPSDA